MPVSRKKSIVNPDLIATKDIIQNRKKQSNSHLLSKSTDFSQSQTSLKMFTKSLESDTSQVQDLSKVNMSLDNLPTNEQAKKEILVRDEGDDAYSNKGFPRNLFVKRVQKSHTNEQIMKTINFNKKSIKVEPAARVTRKAQMRYMVNQRNKNAVTEQSI